MLVEKFNQSVELFEQGFHVAEFSKYFFDHFIGTILIPTYKWLIFQYWKDKKCDIKDVYRKVSFNPKL